jgi:hypothetical protein
MVYSTFFLWMSQKHLTLNLQMTKLMISLHICLVSVTSITIQSAYAQRPKSLDPPYPSLSKFNLTLRPVEFSSEVSLNAFRSFSLHFTTLPVPTCSHLHFCTRLLTTLLPLLFQKWNHAMLLSCSQPLWLLTIILRIHFTLPNLDFMFLPDLDP